MKKVKVFMVMTGMILDDGRECETMASYNVLGKTAEDAISAARKLMGKGEYAVSIEHKLTLS